MSLTDQTIRSRAGEELDAAVIDGYLKDHIPGLAGPAAQSASSPAARPT